MIEQRRWLLLKEVRLLLAIMWRLRWPMLLAMEIIPSNREGVAAKEDRFYQRSLEEK
jgi:hypothetical protein